MPRVATVFFVSIYGLVAIAGLMLAFAEGSPFPEILTPALAIVAYVLTDRTRTVHLPVLWANALGVLAFSCTPATRCSEQPSSYGFWPAPTWSFISPGSSSSRKSTCRNTGGCALLSVLQVAIGSILTISSSYGGMLLGFMFAAIWTLVGLFALSGPSAIRPVGRTVRERGLGRPHEPVDQAD